MAGEKGLFRFGLELAEGVEGPDSTYTRFISETFKMGRPYEPDPNLDASGNETEGDSLKAEGKGKLTLAPNTESTLALRVHQYGFYDHTTPTAGVELWELRDFDEISDTPIAEYVDSFWFGVWRDEETDPSEYVGLGAKISEFTLSVDANKHVRYEFDALYLRDRYMATPSEVAVNAAYTGVVLVRGHRQSGDESGSYFKFKVPAASGGALDGTAKLVFGKGVAAYGTTPYPVVAGEWLTVYEADDTLGGTRREPIEIMFVKGAPGDVLTVADEWHIDPTSDKATPVYSSRPKLTGTDLELRFSLNGGSTWITKVINSWSAKHGTPRETKFGLGSKYGGTIGRPQNAKRYWELSFDRSYVDRDFLKALTSGTVISAYSKFYGTLIGATGLEEFSEFTFDRTKVSEAGSTITSPGDLKENPVLRAFSENNSSLCVERHQNTVASL
jgi:hypothetical protein